MTHRPITHRSTTRALVAALALAAVTAHAQPLPARQAPEAAAAPAGAPTPNGRYAIDPTHTFVTYEIGHYGTTTNRGRFSTRDGGVRIDATGRGGSLDITMDISSVNTGVDLLNRHIQSKDFFNVADFPTGRFVSDRLEFEGDKVVRVPGTLTLLGVSKPVVLRAQRFNCYMSPMVNRQVCGGDFETVIQRGDFGITWGLNFGFENDVRLLVQVEAVLVSTAP